MYNEEDAEELRILGQTIRDSRASQELSQEAFADSVGLHRTYMGSVERGERNLSYLNLMKIARALDLDLSVLK